MAPQRACGAWGWQPTRSTCARTSPRSRTPSSSIDQHAKRLAALGCNLVRLTHVDSNWVNPNLIAPGDTTDKLNDDSVKALHYWVKALKDQGIYVFLDLITYRPFVKGDDIPGWQDLLNSYPRNKGRPLGEAFNYLNDRITELWRTTSKDLLTRVNPYTKLALKDDPAVAMVLIWNENTMTGPTGYRFLADKHTPFHRKKWVELEQAFATASGHSAQEIETIWEPGAGKMFLNDIEYKWNKTQADWLKTEGRSPHADRLRTCVGRSGHLHASGADRWRSRRLARLLPLAHHRPQSALRGVLGQRRGDLSPGRQAEDHQRVQHGFRTPGRRSTATAPCPIWRRSPPSRAGTPPSSTPTPRTPSRSTPTMPPG